MEEEETQEWGEISGKDLDNHDGNHVHETVGTSHTEDINTVGDDKDGIENNVVLQGVDSVTTVLDDDQFEQVSLKDHGVHEDLTQSQSSDNLRHSSGGSEEAYEFSTGKFTTEFDSPQAAGVRHDHHSSSSGPERQSTSHIRQSSSSMLVDSALYLYGDGGCSPVGSPQKPTHKLVVPNVSPELLHLVDSAIMGKPESLDQLKNVMSGGENFGNGEEAESIAFLVVDSLLATMGGVESFEEDEDNNPPSVMLNSRAAIVSGELIPWLPWQGHLEDLMSPRTRMVRGLLAILCACTRNRVMCSTAGLLGILLQSAKKIFVEDVGSTQQLKWDGTPLCYCIQYLSGHSLSVIDLHRLFQVITRTITSVWAAHLIDLHRLFAFTTWIYVESFADTLNTATAAAAIAVAAVAKSGKSLSMSAAAAASALAGEGTAHMPRLFSFLFADYQGMEAYFHAQFLVVEVGSGRGKKASLHFTHAFQPQCWYFVGLEHTCKQGLLGKVESELRLYIDRSLYESRPFDFPRISKPLAFCCIGTNPPPTMAGLQRHRRQSPLFAEMGPIYIFKEPIGPEGMARLASRGGDMLPSFGNGAGLPWLATNEHVQIMAEESALLDAEIGGCIHLLYHPNLLSEHYCPDASNSGAAGMLRRPAEVVGQVHVATRMRPAEALWALAYRGPMSLLPLAVNNVHENSLEP